ncbi:MAG TPA: hypothetical protein VN182_05040 [Flavobacterium sp.]|nr:hypothetical protein [Flavobacterium sp.]
MLKYILTFFTITTFSANVFAQFAGFSQEVGMITGPVEFRSDYGESEDFGTNIGNMGFGIGIVHYINFSYRAECNCYNPETYFNDHFKFRSELSYSKTNLEHYGQWVADSETSKFANQLRAMQGSTAETNIGVQLEYFPFSIRRFTNTIGSLGPYVSLGGQFTFYDPEVYSTLGKLNTPVSTPKKYYNATTNEGGTVWSIVSSVGTRYKLTPLSDLLVDLRFQYYFSNWVDGLNPDPEIYTENKANDWLIWYNIGYIYYLQ